ncbi:MFS transporter permease [Microbacterium sp. C7(2022)]|uniref:MFS transporter permease n=1 Tax=Microbacterium sp. C7(2022) TaxID=2992759 RepID=UPI00237A1F7F|nr:MFS transporter permease [Microbacterium sp. C7(2022)]MDE0546904.1 MFS transporter permease [Microbacterium sp. C7(2022)]
MWLRRAFYGWLIPAAFVLPLWLFIGWGVFNAGGWAFLWVLLLAIPSVFIGQLILTLLVRARGTVRATRAVSWWDVLGIGVWHALTISLGFFNEQWWAQTFVATVIVAVALFWLELWQLWREAKPARIVLRGGEQVAYVSMPRDEGTSPASSVDEEVFILKERPPAS